MHEISAEEFLTDVAAVYSTIYQIELDRIYGYMMSLRAEVEGTPLKDRAIGLSWNIENDKDLTPGRRFRVAAALRGAENPKPFTPETVENYGDWYDYLMEARPQWPSSVPLQIATKGAVFTTEIGEFSKAADPSLHPALQDLGNEINEDIHEACAAFDNPDLYYPGVDEGIEPVTDEHVELVIWGMQRELLRELRSNGFGQLLPAAPLAELPHRIQRALVERRRLRFQQFGIGYEEWKANRWSLYSVPEDADWIPRRQARLAGLG